MTGQKLVQLVGEGIAFALAQRRRPAGMQTTGAHAVHEVTHAQPALYVLNRIQLTARIQRMPALVDNLGRKRDVAGNHQVARFQSLDDLVVGDVKTGRHLDHLYILRWWCMHRLVRHQRQYHPGTVSGAEQYFLDHDRTGVGVYPYFQFMFLLRLLHRDFNRV